MEVDRPGGYLVLVRRHRTEYGVALLRCVVLKARLELSQSLLVRSLVLLAVGVVRIAAVLVFLGFNVTFFVQFIMGTKGMPRRYHTYAKVSKELMVEFQMWHRISTFGSWILLTGLVITAVYLLASFWRGFVKGKYDAGPNPWGGKSLEWEAQSPPDPHNFVTDPVCLHGPYEFDEAVSSYRGYAHVHMGRQQVRRGGGPDQAGKRY